MTRKLFLVACAAALMRNMRIGRRHQAEDRDPRDHR